jgi:signal transduction histidine kinase
MSNQDANTDEEDWGTIVATMVHEISAPLASARGFVNLAVLMLKKDDFDKQEVLSFLETSYRSLNRLNHMTASLLDISRLRLRRLNLTIEQLNLGDLISEVINSMQPEIALKEISTVIDIPADLPAVSGDHGRIVQILSNLIDNAYKYTPKGGRIAITARLAGGSAQIDVSDTGIGIAADDQSKLFTRFFRVNRPEVRDVPGTGLGLYIIKSLVDMMGGHIWLESQLEKGSTFSFTLPIAKDIKESNGENR